MTVWKAWVNLFVRWKVGKSGHGIAWIMEGTEMPVCSWGGQAIDGSSGFLTTRPGRVTYGGSVQDHLHSGVLCHRDPALCHIVLALCVQHIECVVDGLNLQHLDVPNTQILGNGPKNPMLLLHRFVQDLEHKPFENAWQSLIWFKEMKPQLYWSGDFGLYACKSPQELGAHSCMNTYLCVSSNPIHICMEISGEVKMQFSSML